MVIQGHYLICIVNKNQWRQLFFYNNLMDLNIYDREPNLVSGYYFFMELSRGNFVFYLNNDNKINNKNFHMYDFLFKQTVIIC